MMKSPHFASLLACGAVFICSYQLYGAPAAKKKPKFEVPFEYDYPGIGSTGLGPGGVTHGDGSTVVRTNPSLMALKPTFIVDGAHYWESTQSRYGQYGAIDSAKSKIAAGVQYSNLSSKDTDPDFSKDPRFERFSLALASRAGDAFSLGFGVNYTKGLLPGELEAKGLSYGMGVSGILGGHFRYGASVENLSNKTLREFAPQVRRLGVGIEGSRGHLALEFRQRELVPTVEILNTTKVGYEHMAITSGRLLVYNRCALIGGYGYELGGDKRKTASGGVELATDKIVVGFHHAIPELSKPKHTYQVISAKLILK